MVNFHLKVFNLLSRMGHICRKNCWRRDHRTRQFGFSLSQFFAEA
jgi:hypothetical protein